MGSNDATGRIRYKHVRGEKLDEAIHALLGEMKARSAEASQKED